MREIPEKVTIRMNAWQTYLQGCGLQDTRLLKGPAKSPLHKFPETEVLLTFSTYMSRTVYMAISNAAYLSNDADHDGHVSR